MLHTVGSHSDNLNEIYTSTFTVSSSHVLESDVIRKFTMDADIKVIGVGTRPEDDLYDVYITYMEINSDLQVGKVLYANLADPSSARMYDFMSSKTSSLGN